MTVSEALKATNIECRGVGRLDNLMVKVIGGSYPIWLYGQTVFV